MCQSLGFWLVGSASSLAPRRLTHTHTQSQRGTLPTARGPASIAAAILVWYCTGTRPPAGLRAQVQYKTQVPRRLEGRLARCTCAASRSFLAPSPPLVSLVHVTPRTTTPIPNPPGAGRTRRGEQSHRLPESACCSRRPCPITCTLLWPRLAHTPTQQCYHLGLGVFTRRGTPPYCAVLRPSSLPPPCPSPAWALTLARSAGTADEEAGCRDAGWPPLLFISVLEQAGGLSSCSCRLEPNQGRTDMDKGRARPKETDQAPTGGQKARRWRERVEGEGGGRGLTWLLFFASLLHPSR